MKNDLEMKTANGLFVQMVTCEVVGDRDRKMQVEMVSGSSSLEPRLARYCCLESFFFFVWLASHWGKEREWCKLLGHGSTWSEGR